MPDVVVNGLRMKAGNSRGNGANRVEYCIYGRLKDMEAITFPGHRTMRRLAHQYLGCELEKHTFGRFGGFYFFYINGGIKQEKRAAFLAAVIANSKRSN